MASHIERRKFLATLGGRGGVAGHGEGAAAGDAGHRISRDQIARNHYRAAACFPPGPQRNRLCRGREHSDRLPLGRADVNDFPNLRPSWFAGR